VFWKKDNLVEQMEVMEMYHVQHFNAIILENLKLKEFIRSSKDPLIDASPCMALNVILLLVGFLYYLSIPCISKSKTSLRAPCWAFFGNLASFICHVVVYNLSLNYCVFGAVIMFVSYFLLHV